MLTAIKKIHGLGKFDCYDGTLDLAKNQVIFGFNGSGKSTLSDIFYSLSDERHCEKLMERKTLQRDDGSFADSPFVLLKTESGDLVFQNGQWNKNKEIYVFNEQYIDDYVTLIEGHDIEKEQLVLGKEGSRLFRTQTECKQQRDDLFRRISSVITNNKEICGALGLGKSKLSIETKNWIRKIKAVTEVKLFSEAEKDQVQKSLEDFLAFDKDYNCVLKWENELKAINMYGNSQISEELKLFEKNLKLTPFVTNKEISEHISKYMSNMDVNWLIRGMDNRIIDSEHCPFCGQELKDKKVIRLSKQLNKFIKGKQKKKADDITEYFGNIEHYFNEREIEKLLLLLQTILKENEDRKILHKKTIQIIESMQMAEIMEPGCFSELILHIQMKKNNPYQVIHLQEDEISLLRKLVKVFRKIEQLGREIDKECEIIKRKAEKTKEYEKRKALFAASFGENQENFRQLIQDAKKVLTYNQRITEYQRKIDQLAETQKIDKINDILEELNVNYHVQVENNKFYVKIAGYVQVEYDKENKILCSEGEKRMLAFAYFMQELALNAEGKMIVIDDPISSLDLSRKSVVAYKIAKLMEAKSDQVIVLTHDISFVEKIHSLESSKIEQIKYTEVRKNKETPFADLVMEDYLISDKKIYEELIARGTDSDNPDDHIVALMALRPYTYLAIGAANSEKYNAIERKTTYFHHTRYSKSKRVNFDANQYNPASLRALCTEITSITGLEIDANRLIPDDFAFSGFVYDNSWNMYELIPAETLPDLRKKAMVFRVLLEASLFMLVTRKQFDPEHIGKFYSKAESGQQGEKKELCAKIKRLYDLSKKYHHGAEEGSTLGLAALNADEMNYFNQSITKVHEWIITHMEQCNENRMEYIDMT